MSRRVVGFLMVAVLSVLTVRGAAADQAQDEAAIRDLQTKQENAWNKHDARAYAALFAEDGDAVNAVGWRWKGRRQLESKLAEAFSSVFKDSRLTITGVDVRFLKPDVAVVHATWKMTGARTPQGMPEPRQGIQVQVMQKQSGGWAIATLQNTLSLPEMPFPPAGASFPRGASYPSGARR